MRSVLQKIFLLLFLLAGYFSNAQVKFSASISPSEIGKDEYAQLKLVVENANEIQQIVPPNLRDFIIISGPNQESGMTMINGAVKKYFALNFVLKPKAIGVFTIPAALAKADGGDYKSNAVSLRVSKGSSGNNTGVNALNSPFSSIDPFAEPAPRSNYNDYILRKGENPADKIKKNMFVRVEVNKNSCYVGEPIVATYKLYTRLKSESNMIKNPSFNGFSVLDIQQPNDMSFRTEKFEGREYNVYIIRKAQLYPLLSGNLELGIMEIENNVQFYKAEFVNQQPDIFNDMIRNLSDANMPPEGIEIQKVTLQSKPLSVLVKPLPEVDKPAGFKGATGNFTIDARIENKNFTTDDAGRMAIVISGEGNLQMINAPEIAWPQGIEGFEPKATDDLFKGTVPVSGRKIFEFPFTVSKPGNYVLPSVPFSFFDTRDAKYKTVITNPITFTVTKGTGKSKNTLVKTGTNSNDNFIAQFFSNRLRVVSLFAVLIIIGLVTWLKRDKKRERDTKQIIEETAPITVEENPVEEILLAQENPLALAEECLIREDGNLFYTQLNLGLKKYLSKKLSIPAEELNRKNIAEKMDAKGISIETSVQVQELIDEIQWQLYTPLVDNEKMKGMYDKANNLIQFMNTYRS
ncbi:MAG: BatD family protein [Ferruginibacter sp.]